MLREKSFAVKKMLDVCGVRNWLSLHNEQTGIRVIYKQREG